MAQIEGPTQDGEAVLNIRDLKTYFFSSGGMVKAVNGVTMDVRRGEIIGIVGESGSGKSVIALSVLRLIPYPGKIVDGEIFFRGEDVLKLSPAEMVKIRGRKIGMIFQDPMSCLNPVFTIGEQIASGVLAHNNISKQEARKRAVEMLRTVNIPDPERRLNGFQHELSGGMKQRVMIALALACDPELLIADNPTTALDSTIQLQFLNLILELRKKWGMTILYITHDFGVVAKLCDRVAVLYAGEIVEFGSAYHVLKDPLHPYTRALIAATPALGMRDKRIEAPEGKLTNLAYLPPGCKFASRCARKVAECEGTAIDLVERGTDRESHLVRCIDC
jgi:oligopeptide/dipeptide ABC transporter ATP-binding protein